MGRQAWAIYAVLCAAFIASQFFRVSNAVIAPELMASLGIGTATMGVVTGVYFLAFAAMQIPAGALLDRYGARRTMSGLFLLAGAGAVLFASAGSGLALIAGRALIGIGCALGLMGAMVVIARWFPKERYARQISLLYTLGGLGSLLASTPLAAVSEAIGWRGAFLVMAAVTVVSAIALLVVIRDAPGGETVPAVTASWGNVLAGLREVFGNREIWRICAIQFVCYAGVLSVVGLWAGPYLNDVHGMSVLARGNVLLALNIAMLAAVMLFAQVERWLNSRRTAIIGGGGVSIGALAVLALVPAPGPWAAFALLALFTVSGSYFMLIHAHARAVLPDRLMGRGLTAQNLAVMLGVFVVQSLCGVIIDAFSPAPGQAPEIAYRAAFGFLALCLTTGLVLYSPISDVAPRSEGRPAG